MTRNIARADARPHETLMHIPRPCYALLALLPGLLLTTPARADSDTYRYDSGHSGYTADTLTPPLSLLWRHTTEPSVGSTASPLSAGGLVYFTAGAHVYAVSAVDGATVWQYPAATDTTQAFAATPAIADGSVYVGSDGGVLYRLDAHTGKVSGSVKVGGPVRGAPVVEDGVVYFGSADFHCYAANAQTMGLLWSFATGGTILTSPCIAGDDVIFASSDDAVTCVAKASGHKQWALDFEGDPTSSPPVYGDGTLYVGAGSTLYAIDSHTGATRWTRDLTGAATTPPTLWPGGIAVGTLDGNFSVYGLGGRLRWRDGLGAPCLAPTLLASGLMLVPVQHGVLYALQSEAGGLAWEYVAPASVTKKVAPTAATEINSAPLLSGGTLYVLSDDGTLSALRADALAALPPRVTDLTPTPGSTIAGTSVAPGATVLALGSGLDPSSVSLTLDGQPLPGVAYSAGQSRVTPAPATLGKQDDGAHELVLKATDWRGNTVTQSWGFFVDNTLDPATPTPTP